MLFYPQLLSFVLDSAEPLDSLIYYAYICAKFQ